MRYRITFTDHKKPAVLVSKESGEALMLERSREHPVEFVSVQGGQYPIKSIKDIEPVQDPAPSGLRIEYNVPKCRGQYSIQFKIMQEWNTKKREMPYSEFASKAYEYLYTVTDKWCDYKKDKCYCSDDYRPKSLQERNVVDVENVFGLGVDTLA